MTWTTTRLRWFPLIALCLLAACNGGDGSDELPPGVVEGSPTVAPASGSASITPTSSPTTSTCANEESVASDPARQLGTSLEADVDGDGVVDRIALALDPESDQDCAAFVVVDLGDQVAAAPTWEIGPQGGLPQPRLHGLVDIDGQPGQEILVDEAAGASTQFVGAFVYADGDLHRIEIAGPARSGASGFEDLFAYGGSVGHVEAVDCVGGRIAVSVATPGSSQDELAAGVYDVERRFFTFDDGELESAEVQRSETPIDDLDRFPEFGGSPFGSC